MIQFEVVRTWTAGSNVTERDSSTPHNYTVAACNNVPMTIADRIWDAFVVPRLDILQARGESRVTTA